MTQTVGAKSMRNVKVAYSSTSNFIWNDISGTLNTLEVSGGERVTGDAYTADGDTPILLFGKLGAFEVKSRIVYSEVTAEAWIDLEALYAAGTDIKLQWAPGGYATGNLLFRTNTTQITGMGYPGGDVSNGAPILAEFTVKCGDINYARMTTASGTY